MDDAVLVGVVDVVDVVESEDVETLDDWSVFVADAESDMGVDGGGGKQSAGREGCAQGRHGSMGRGSRKEEMGGRREGWMNAGLASPGHAAYYAPSLILPGSAISRRRPFSYLSRTTQTDKRDTHPTTCSMRSTTRTWLSAGARRKQMVSSAETLYLWLALHRHMSSAQAALLRLPALSPPFRPPARPRLPPCTSSSTAPILPLVARPRSPTTSGGMAPGVGRGGEVCDLGHSRPSPLSPSSATRTRAFSSSPTTHRPAHSPPDPRPRPSLGYLLPHRHLFFRLRSGSIPRGGFADAGATSCRSSQSLRRVALSNGAFRPQVTHCSLPRSIELYYMLRH